MDYAHQGIDLKPIMGVDAPMPEKDAKPKVASATDADANALPPMVRPRSLSGQSTRLIRELGQRLRSAPALTRPAGPSAQVTALPETTGSTQN